MDASTLQLEQPCSPQEKTLEMYGELLGCARRMLKIARTHRWTSLMSEEVEFFRVYEQIAANEAAHVYTGEQLQLRDVFQTEIFSRVDSTRALLNERKQQLAAARRAAQSNASGLHARYGTCCESEASFA